MLKDQHRFATLIVNPRSKQEYKYHMCGLCNALGKEYGLPFRVLTSYDSTLLSILVQAQQHDCSPLVRNPCPINPFKKVSTYAGAGSKYSASVAMCLANLQNRDDINDSRHFNIGGFIRNMICARFNQKALDNIKNILETYIFNSFTGKQNYQEMTGGYAAIPTANMASTIFSASADIAGNSSNKIPLSIIGRNYGEYIYLMDALRDFPKDLKKGQYNPLSLYAKKGKRYLVLSLEGIKWLSWRLKEIQGEIMINLGQLVLYRNRELIRELLIKPIDEVITMLDSKQASEFGFIFQTLEPMDILKAMVFILPILAAPVIANELAHVSAQDVAAFAKHYSTELSQSLGMTINHPDWIRDAIIKYKPNNEICSDLCNSIDCGTPLNSCCDTSIKGCSSSEDWCDKYLV